MDGDLPWRLSSDLKFFKQTTMGKPVLMGRVTWDSLPFPLPGRPNLVLTRNKNFAPKKAEVFSDMNDMIGRARLYAQTMKYADRLYVTDVDAMIEGDAHFPAISAMDWEMVSQTEVPQGPKDDYPFTIKVYDRRRN